MTAEENASRQRGAPISPNDVSAIKVVNDRLILTLHNGATIAIPCDAISLDHNTSGSESHGDITLSDDWHHITWPALSVSISVQDLFEQWILQPRLARSIVYGDTTRYLSNEGGAKSSNVRETGIPADADRTRVRQFTRQMAGLASADSTPAPTMPQNDSELPDREGCEQMAVAVTGAATDSGFSVDTTEINSLLAQGWRVHSTVHMDTSIAGGGSSIACSGITAALVILHRQRRLPSRADEL